MEKLVLASNNSHKIKEFRELLKDREILSLKDIGFDCDIDETGTTFLENALIKAKTVQEYLKEKGIVAGVLADDSGLCVNALDGAPGIYSARFAGGHGDSEKNRQKLLSLLADKADRSAYFNCVIVWLFSNGSYIYSEGKTFGHITKEYHGDTSFGYDCLFYSDDLKKTFGESSDDEKNSVSHRGRAIVGLLDKAKLFLG